MAGACMGFLTQNKYKAKVFMGNTGSLALGGGLAAMASCTGMFLPLFIASGVFIIETVSVIVQVLYLSLVDTTCNRKSISSLCCPEAIEIDLIQIKSLLSFEKSVTLVVVY